MNSKFFIVGLWLSGSVIAVLATLYKPEVKENLRPVAFLQTESRWADSVLQNMSTSAKIKQLFVLVDSAPTEGVDTSLFSFLEKYQPGGVLFRKFDVNEQFQRIRKAQSSVKVPLFVGLDERSEDPMWVQMPKTFELGAIEDDTLIGELGTSLGGQSKKLGAHFILTPSFSGIYDPQNRNRLSQKEAALNKQILDQEIFSVPKNVHAFFPAIYDSAKIKNLLLPYHKLAKAGLPALLLEKEQFAAVKTHFHKKGLIQDYLQDEIDFEGLLMVDLSDVSEVESRESFLRKTIQMGIDLMILNRVQLPYAYEVVLDMLSRGTLVQSDLDRHVKRALLAKSWTHTSRDRKKAFEPDSLELDKSRIAFLNEKVSIAKLTLLRDKQNLIPFTKLRDKRIHLSSLGEDVPHLLRQLRSYGPVSNTDFGISKKTPWAPLPVRTLKTYNPVILSLSGSFPDKRRDTAFLASVKELSEKTELIFVNFSTPEALTQMPELDQVLQVYGSDSMSQIQVAQLLFGGVGAEGKLPVEMGPYAFESGLSTKASRLRHIAPEAVGLSSQALATIDSIVYEGMGSYAMPGCQVMVVKDGNVIFDESYGHHTYARRRGVFPTDIYDLASITKVAATTLAAMHLYEQGLLRLDHRLGRFFENQTVLVDSVRVIDTLFVGLDSLMRQNTELLAALEPKADTSSVFIKVWMGAKPAPWIDTLALPGDSVMLVKSIHAGKMKKRGSVFQAKIGEMMTHTSGLPAGLPIRRYTRYKNAEKKIGKYDKYFHPKKDSLYSIQVAGGFYLRNDYRDSLWQESKLIEYHPAKEYEYSDANMILLQQAIDSINGESMDLFLSRVFYERLGMQNTGFRPRDKFEEDRLVPTEYDGQWRGQLLRGYVHDPTSALLGGVAGNAGLFANANDLAILFQMLLNGGSYGGEKYLSPQTINTFTRTQGTYRGYGFDKNPGSPYIIADSASMNSYGHTGFTGTCVWVDPDEDLIFIFLSNRIHPKANNWKINQLRIRQRIHQVVYNALAESKRSPF